jgi:hypothetical protein
VPGPRPAGYSAPPFPQLPAQRVVGETLHLLAQPVGIEALDRSYDLRVELAAPVAEQTAVCHLVRERVLEGVLQVREEQRLVEELRLLQMREPAPRLLRVLRDRCQKRVRHVLTGHGGRLQKLLLILGQTIDTRRQDRLHRCRHLQRLHRPREAVRCALTDQRSLQLVETTGSDARPTDTLRTSPMTHPVRRRVLKAGIATLAAASLPGGTSAGREADRPATSLC